MEELKKVKGTENSTQDSVKNQVQDTKSIVQIPENTSLNDDLVKSNSSKPKTIQEIIKEAEVDPYSKIEKPPTVLSIDGVSYGTLGNFSCLTGKAKSRKTFFLSILIASALDVHGKFQRIKTEIPKTQVLHFDTEQSEYHTQKVAKRIISLVDDEKITQIYYQCYSLRPYPPELRTEIIREKIYNTKNIKLVVIDGIADLILGYNNEERAITIVNDIMRWTAELNIHIITILHQNKGDNNAKGHLGSIILQKAETVLSVEKDKEISTVTPTYSRDIDINPMSFSIDDNELPYFVEYQESKVLEKRIKHPRDVNKEVHITILNEVFDKNEELSSTNFKAYLKETLAKYSINIGDNLCRDWKAFYDKNDFIVKENQQAPYTLNKKYKMVS